jgi:hypothetical protein
MKKRTFSSIFVALGISISLISLQACNKGTSNETEKKVSLINDQMNFSIPVILGSGDNDSITSFYYKMNMDSFVKSYDSKYDTSSIRSVKLQSCNLILSNGDTLNNFRNFHTTNIGITSGTNKNIFRIAAFTDIVDTNAYVISIPTSYDPNLASYFKSDSVRYRLYGNARKMTTKAINCTANISFEVKLVK